MASTCDTFALGAFGRGALYSPPACFAATKPDVKSPGLAVAAMGGLPWFAEARSSGLFRAACMCCVCASTGPTCCSLAKASCCALGRASTPPLPPLEQTCLPDALLTGGLYVLCTTAAFTRFTEVLYTKWFPPQRPPSYPSPPYP